MNQDMQRKVVVITGATSGIGQVAAERLAGMGARIVQIARDRERGQQALQRLGECAGDIAHSIHYADLSRVSEMKRVAAEIAQVEPRIDVLINNAGAIFSSYQPTEDGTGAHFRVESSLLLRAGQRPARSAGGVGSGTGREYFLRCPQSGRARSQRFAIGRSLSPRWRPRMDPLRRARFSSLRPFQTLQHSVYP